MRNALKVALLALILSAIPLAWAAAPFGGSSPPAASGVAASGWTWFTTPGGAPMDTNEIFSFRPSVATDPDWTLRTASCWVRTPGTGAGSISIEFWENDGSAAALKNCTIGCTAAMGTNVACGSSGPDQTLNTNATAWWRYNAISPCATQPNFECTAIFTLP